MSRDVNGCLKPFTSHLGTCILEYFTVSDHDIETRCQHTLHDVIKTDWGFREIVTQLYLFAPTDIRPFKFGLDCSHAMTGHFCHLGAHWINTHQVWVGTPVRCGYEAALSLFSYLCTHSSHLLALRSLEYQNQHPVLRFKGEWQIWKAEAPRIYPPSESWFTDLASDTTSLSKTPTSSWLSLRHLQTTYSKQNVSLPRTASTTCLISVNHTVSLPPALVQT